MKKDLHKLVAFLAMLLLPFSVFSQDYGQNLFESFEKGIPETWSQDTISGNVGWIKETGGSMPNGAFEGQARLKFSANATVTTDAVARLITPDLNKIANGNSEQLNFSQIIDPVLIFAHAQEKWTNDFDVLRILYRTSADGKWNKLKEYDNYISKWTVDTISLAVVSGSQFLQLAFEATDNLGRGVVIDRVEVRSAPSCFAPTSLTVENISNDSADIRWSGSWDVESFTLKVSTVPLTAEQLEDQSFKADVFDEILERTRKATVKNLPADAKFYFYIRSNCYGEYSTWAVDSFRTDNFLAFPYFENFNYRATPGYPTRMEGWYYGSSEDSFDPFVNTGRDEIKENYSNDTSFVLSFYGNHYYLNLGGPTGYMIPAKSYSYAVMPKLPDSVDIERMYLSFKTIRTEVMSSNYQIIVGVMENPRDLNTFEAVDTIKIESVNVLEEPFVYFKDYKGKGKNIAFLSKFDVENCFNIDDLRLDYVTPIEKVNNFKIGIPSSTSISIDFDADYVNYEVVVSATKVAETELSTAEDVIRRTITDKGIVDGLTAGQHYFVYVRAIEGNDFGEWSNVRYVYMPGKVEALPFMLGGDIDTKGTSTHPNWSGGNTYIYKVGKNIDKIINSPAYYNGAIALFNNYTGPSFEAVNASQSGISTASTKFVSRCFVSGETTFVPGIYAALVMPEIVDFDNARVTFYIQNIADNNAFSSTVVGLLSDANDISTFTPIDTINLNDGESKNVFYDLGKHSKKGKFFAIYASTDDVEGKAIDNRFFIDNIEVVNMPPCPDPTDFTFTSAPNDPSKVTMTWNANGATAWVVRISEQAYSPDEMDGEKTVYVYNDTVRTNSLTLENLQFPKHKYYYSLRSICDSETYGEWTYFESFETECYTAEKLPYVENFNNYNIVDIYSEELIAPCLASQLIKNGRTQKSYPQVVSVLGVLDNNRLALQKQSDGRNTYVAFPRMEKLPNQLQISFDVYWTDINTSISVGVMDNPYDSLSFTEVERITYDDGRTNQTVRYVVSFADYAGKGEYIAISTNSDSKVYGMIMAEIFIDNVIIENINTCVRPEGVKLTEMFADSVRLEWKPIKDVNKWAVLLSSKELTQEQLLDPLNQGEEEPLLPSIKTSTTTFDVRIDTVESNPAVIRNLAPNTPYFVYVKSLCGDNSASMWSNVISISTACVEIEPENSPIENFDANSRGVVPACFMVGNVSNKYDMAAMPMTTPAFAHSGGMSLQFNSQVSGTTITNGAYAITSRINIDDISKLQISLWGCVGDPVYATVNYARALIVGVITDPFNISTFVPIDTLNLGIEWRPYDVIFADYKGDDYGHKGQYVMFMSDFNLDNIAYIDDITFGLQKDCYTSVELTNVKENSVEVLIYGTAPYQVVYSDKMLSETELGSIAPIDIEKGNSITISNLNSNTNYYVYARSTCDKVWSEWSTVEVVRTNCVEKITLPFTDGFEKNLAYGYAANPDCWFSYYKKGDVVYPQVHPNAYVGERSVLLESASATEQAFLVTSEIADVAVAECMVVFYAQPYLDRGYVETPSLVVGVVEDVNNIADSFVPVDTIMLSGRDWARQEVLFANYNGKGSHIAFMSDYALNNQLKGSFFIDDVLIEVVPKCARPKDFAFVAHTDTSITVSFKHDSDVKCEVKAGPVGFDPMLKDGGIVTESANNDTIEAKGLAQNTKYDLYVRTFCNEVDASPWTFAGTYFTVQEYIKVLPYVYSFDDPTENAKWGFAQDNQTDKWYIGTDTVYAVSETNSNDTALYVSFDGGSSMMYLNYISSGTDSENPGIKFAPRKLSKEGSEETLNSSSFSWAYRTVYLESGVYDVSYAWTCTGNTDERGRTSTDYMKVVFVPSTAALCSDSRGGAGISFDGDITYMNPYRMEGYVDLIDVSGSYYVEDPRAGQIELPYMQGNNGWSRSECEVMIEEAGMYNMAFAWLNIQEGTTTETIRSGAIDDISIVRQSCSAPYNLQQTELGYNSSEFTWSSLEDEAEYIVKVTSNVKANFGDLTDADFAFVDTVSTKSVKATGLAPSTYYNIYVATLCGADNASGWSEPLGFETLCAPFKVDSLYTFDGISSIPQCFVAGHIKTGSTNYKAPTIMRNNSSYIFDRTGVYSATASENGAAIQITHPGGNNTTQGRSYTGGYLVFPMFEGVLNDYTLTFWMRCLYHNVTPDAATGKHAFATTAYLGGTYARKISVGTMSDPNDPSTFKLLQVCDYTYTSSMLSGKKVEDDPTGSDYWVKFSVSLADAQGQFIVFMDEDYGKRNNWVMIDDIMVSSKYCKEPEDVKVDTVKMNSAVITFKGEAEKYVVELSETKEFDKVLARDTISSLSYKFENLESKTQYFARIQSVCSAFEKSDWSTITFKTLRGVVFDEIFPESMICPDDWSRSNDGKRVASVLDVKGTTFEYTPVDNKSGWISVDPMFENAMFSSRHMATPLTNSSASWLFTPGLDLNEVNAKYHLSFNVALTALGLSDPITDEDKKDVNNKFVVLVSEDGGNTWLSSNITEWGSSGDYSLFDIPNTGASYSIDLTKYAGKSIQIAFCAEALGATGATELHLDDVHVNVYREDLKEVPLCQSMDFEDENFMITSDNLTIGENNFTKWTLATKEDVLYKLVLDVAEMKETYLPMVNICEEGSYSDNQNGFIGLTKSGRYKRKLSSVNGCDSVIILDLNIVPTVETQIFDTICQGQSVVWNGKEYNRTGIYSDTLLSVLTGCDSIVSLVLTVNAAIPHTEYAYICYGESYDFYGKTITESGSYEHLVKTPGSCDSLFTLIATVLPDYSNIVINDAITEGEIYNKNGFVGLTTPGSYKLPLKSKVGDCDSIITLNLVVGNANYYEDVNLCFGDTLQFGSQTITQSGQYIVEFATDSVVLFNVTALPDLRQTLDVVICKGETYNENGFTNKTETGVYTLPLVSVDGCDSTITLNLTVLNGETIYVTDTVTTEELPYDYMDLHYDVATAPGTYKETIVIEAENCKDIIEHTLVVVLTDAIDNVEQTELTLVPNPVNANSTLYVEAEFTANERKDMFVEVFNTVGQRVYAETPVVYPITIDGLIERGVYVVRIITGEGTVYQGKVVVK